MRLRRLRLGLVAIVAAAVVACNALTGLSDDYRLADAPIDGGGDDSTLADGQSPGDDGPSTLPDSGKDADATVPLGAFCEEAGARDAASNIVFCTDFEPDASGPDWGWFTHDTQNGTLTVQEGGGMGGTRGLRAYAMDAGGSRKAALVQKFQALPSAHYELSFSFKVRSNELAYLVIGLVGFNVDGSSNYYGLAEHNQVLLDISTPPGVTDNVGLQDVPHDQWRSAKITLDRVDGGATYNGTMTVDGTLVDAFNGLASANQNAEIRLGAFFTASGPGTAEVFFDNVVVHRQ